MSTAQQQHTFFGHRGWSAHRQNRVFNRVHHENRLGLIRSDWPRSQLIGPNWAWSGVSPKLGPDFGERQSRQNWQKLRQENQQNCHFPNFCEVSLLAWPWFNLKYCNIW
jgi:hypothetical protein